MGIPGLNSKVLDKVIKTLGLQTAVERLPVDLMPTIQPVLEVNPDHPVDLIGKASSTGIIYTTPTDRDFFLTYISLSSVSKDAGATTEDVIDLTLESGLNKDVLSVMNGSGATEVNAVTESVNFNPPIKLKRGTNISVTIASTAGRAKCAGYSVDIL